MKVKTSTLIGPALDWAVALAQGATNLKYDTIASWWFVLEGKDRTLSKGWSASQSYNPSTNWSQGGALIEREKIAPAPHGDGWLAYYQNTPKYVLGPTFLIAAMRCYVSAKIGDEVEIPGEFCK